MGLNTVFNQIPQPRYYFSFQLVFSNCTFNYILRILNMKEPTYLKTLGDFLRYYNFELKVRFVGHGQMSTIDYSNLRTLKIRQSKRSKLRQMLTLRSSCCKYVGRQLSICAYVRTGADTEALVIASAVSSIRKMAYFVLLPVTIMCVNHVASGPCTTENTMLLLSAAA